MLLDISTLYIMVALCSVVAGIVHLTAAAGGRFDSWAKWWGVGHVLLGASAVAPLLRPLHLPGLINIGNAIAATGCQSPLITDFLALANTPTSQASAMDAALDLRLQRSLQFVQDIADAPCAPPGDSTGCLIPAASALRSIAAAPVRRPRDAVPRRPARSPAGPAPARTVPAS